MKGAFAEITSTFGLSMPNLVVFQFNPETLKHSWTQAQAAPGSNPLAVQGLPGEAFSFTLSMDATDQLADPASPGGVDALANGIYSRLSALEMLMFPAAPANPLPAAPGGGAGEQRAVPSAQLPTVLFVWGPGRIVPVRVLSVTITEKLFDGMLNPTHADALVELRVLTPTELDALTGPLKEIATAAYHYTQNRRELGALLNLNNAAGAIQLPALPGA
jgi:hypothetical protein